MHRRAVRLSLLALLVLTGLTATYLTWDAHSRIRHGITIERDVNARLDRMSAATSALGASQQAYVAPGQQRGDSLTRASVLVQQVYDDMAALRLGARSNEAAAVLLAFGKAMDGVVNIDDRIREHLRQEQGLMAADLIYTEARQGLDAMASQLNAFRAAETLFAEAERRALFAREASIIGGAALVWLLGLLLLARVPSATEAVPASDTDMQGLVVDTRAPASVFAPIDLNAAARVCTDLSLLPNAAALPVALARAARVLDAPGLIVWLGAGEELFPATAHGYGPRTLAKFGPIPRSGTNATATAWRNAAMSIVPGDAGTNGAIVAPLLSSDGCFGVMSAEVRHGRESDEAARAVATMIAAQLSTIVAPWPGVSHTEGSAPSAAEAPGAGSNQAAASA